MNVRRTAGIGDRLQCAEAVAAAGIDQHAAVALERRVALVATGLARMVVNALRVALPDLDHRAPARGAGQVDHAALQMQHLTHRLRRLPQHHLQPAAMDAVLRPAITGREAAILAPDLLAVAVGVDQRLGGDAGGGHADSGLYWYATGNHFTEDGWRDASPSEAAQLFGKFGFRNDRTDYGRTCEIWAANLKNRRAEALEMVGKEQTRRYERYLKFSAWGFFSHRLHLLRFRLKRR